MEIKEQLASEFGLRQDYAENIINLIDEGNTIPFIARYRKEMHGSCDDQVLRDFADRLKYLRNLNEEKEKVQKVITEQGKWTDELAKALSEAMTLTEVEDIYRPYKPKRKTRASVAIAKGLEGLADILQAQSKSYVLLDEAQKYVKEDVPTVEEAVQGAKDIVAERISDNAELRKELREILAEKGIINCTLLENENNLTYETYAGFKQEVKNLPSHRILAINRGEKEKCLKVEITVDEKLMFSVINKHFKKNNPDTDAVMEEVIRDSYDRLLFPALERECRSNLTDRADEQAIKMFEVNLKPLLLEAPLKNNIILGLDPAYRTGCKIAVIDKNGAVLATTVIYPTPPQTKTEESIEKLKALIEKYNVDIISIGNGTASKEAEIFVAELIKHVNRPVSYAVVSEAGASVYSASKLGAEEFPDYDVSLRSAVSIARRLQDPLAELIKIDVKSIGVGQYQHDMPQNRLTEVLTGVVEDCVNSVLQGAVEEGTAYIQYSLRRGEEYEIRAGHKRSHWIWFVFPQARGLGRSPMAERYGIGGREELDEYVNHPLLRARLLEISHALLALPGSDPVAVLGDIDALKVRSSMTLFELTGADPVFGAVLDKYYAGSRDELTLRIVNETWE